MFGYTVDELRSACVDVLVPEGIRHRHAALRAGYSSCPAVRAMGRGTANVLMGCRKDGSEFHVLVGLTPFMKGGKAFVLATIMDDSHKWTVAMMEAKASRADAAFHDARTVEAVKAALIAAETDASRAAAEVMVARAAAEVEGARAVSKARGDTLSTMSHEIRTPLNGCIGAAALLLDVCTTDEQRELASTIVACGEMTLAIVNDILDWQKIDSGRMTIEDISFSPGDVVRDVCDIMRTVADDKCVTLSVERVNGCVNSERGTVTLGAKLRWVRIMGDPNRTRQVLLNFVSNAIKFVKTDGTGRVIIRVGVLPLPAVEAEAGQRHHTHEIVLSVEDNGEGMDEETVSTIFKPFTQASNDTARKHGGTGLGLSICKALTALMGGDIALVSKREVGSTFTARMPTRVAAVSRTNTSLWERATTSSELIGARIMVVDDNALNRRLTSAMLTKLGCVVETASDGDEAVYAWQRSVAGGVSTFDALFMDCRMPRMDGFAATREIRRLEAVVGHGAALLPHIPILALTADAMPEDRLACNEAGMDGVVTKPVRAVDLQAGLLEVLRGQRSCSPPP